MESSLRTALLGWLGASPSLGAALNAVTEEAPPRASVPWLAIAASASTDWSTKDRAGREVRIALELATRGDDPAATAAHVREIEARVASLPPLQEGFVVVSSGFLRARHERRAGNQRSALLEFRFRLLENQPE